MHIGTVSGNQVRAHWRSGIRYVNIGGIQVIAGPKADASLGARLALLLDGVISLFSYNY